MSSPTLVKGLAELDFPEPARVEPESFLRRPAGLLLLTGPAGSSKTTTIYACLQHLARTGQRHVITIEDPVGQIVPGIMQTELNEAIGLDFARAARHLLRQDPQLIVIGEIRHEETANIAVRAALPGYLVISTLHSGSCRGVCERLLVMCRDHSAVASALDMIINQRLMRRLCGACHGPGCNNCLGTGYRGCVPLVEWVRLDDAMRAQIRLGNAGGVGPKQSIENSARELLRLGVSDEREYRRLFGL